MLAIRKASIDPANCTSVPIKRYVTTVAVTDESSSGRMAFIDMLKSRISSVKSTPASGALKMPAMAAAAPQPSSIVMFLYDKPALRATTEPMAAPEYTIGASAPTLPPKPMVTLLAAMELQVLWALMLESFFETACSTLVTPWLMSSLSR